MATSMTKRGLMPAVLCWLPLVGLVLVLFVAPSSSGAAADASLKVTPGSGSYGGQSIAWSGNIGVPGTQTIHLQRRGSPTADWAEVQNSDFRTDADGSFSFRFPAPAMNGVYFRVVGASGSTPAYLFRTKHQDADLSITEESPLPSDVPLPRGFAVVGERFEIAVDTARGAAGETKPILAGRGMTLQVRGGSDWDRLETGAIGADGRETFGPYGPGAEQQVPGFYRVILDDWTDGGDRVGWMPSLPVFLRLVDRPRPVTHLVAAPDANKVVLTWTLPADPERARVVIARRAGSQAPDPTAAVRSHVIATLPASTDRFVDLDVGRRWTYKYAVYTVSADGVYTAEETRIKTSTTGRSGDR